MPAVINQYLYFAIVGAIYLIWLLIILIKDWGKRKKKYVLALRRRNRDNAYVPGKIKMTIDLMELVQGIFVAVFVFTLFGGFNAFNDFRWVILIVSILGMGTLLAYQSRMFSRYAVHESMIPPEELEETAKKPKRKQNKDTADDAEAESAETSEASDAKADTSDAKADTAETTAATETTAAETNETAEPAETSGSKASPETDETAD